VGYGAVYAQGFTSARVKQGKWEGAEAQRRVYSPWIYWGSRRPSLERLWSIQEVLYTTGILGSHCKVKGDVRILGMSQRKV
jgi:hypothetical protein